MPIKITNYEKMTNIMGIKIEKRTMRLKRLCRSLSVI